MADYQLKSPFISEYLRFYGVSNGRSGSELSSIVEQKTEEARTELRSLLAADEGHIFFTQNATHSANLIIKGKVKPGDHVMICNMIHNAIIRPLHTLKIRKNVSYSIFNPDQPRERLISELKSLIQSNTKLICLNHVSNVLGCETQLQLILEFAKTNKVAVLLDATQSLGSIR